MVYMKHLKLGGVFYDGNGKKIVVGEVCKKYIRDKWGNIYKPGKLFVLPQEKLYLVENFIRAMKEAWGAEDELLNALTDLR